MKLNFPQGKQEYYDISGSLWVPDANNQIDVGSADPTDFLTAGFTYVSDPTSNTAGRPVPPNTYPGMPWFDNQLNSGNGLPIWRNSGNTGWVNGAGASV